MRTGSFGDHHGDPRAERIKKDLHAREGGADGLLPEWRDLRYGNVLGYDKVGPEYVINEAQAKTVSEGLRPVPCGQRLPENKKAA